MPSRNTGCLEEASVAGLKALVFWGLAGLVERKGVEAQHWLQRTNKTWNVEWQNAPWMNCDEQKWVVVMSILLLSSYINFLLRQARLSSQIRLNFFSFACGKSENILHHSQAQWQRSQHNRREHRWRPLCIIFWSADGFSLAYNVGSRICAKRPDSALISQTAIKAAGIICCNGYIIFHAVCCIELKSLSLHGSRKFQERASGNRDANIRTGTTPSIWPKKSQSCWSIWKQSPDKHENFEVNPQWSLIRL